MRRADRPDANRRLARAYSSLPIFMKRRIDRIAYARPPAATRPPNPSSTFSSESVCLRDKTMLCIYCIHHTFEGEL